MALALFALMLLAVLAATAAVDGYRREQDIFGHAIPRPPSYRQVVRCPAGQVGLSYYDNGNLHARQALLLIHGFLDSKRTWHYVWPHLDRRFRLVAVDLPAAGESDAPDWPFIDRERGLYSLDVLAQVVDAFVAARQGERGDGPAPLPPKLVAVGHSVGGSAVLGLLTRPRGRSARWIRRAILIDPLELSAPSLPMLYSDAEIFRTTPSPLLAMTNFTPIGVGMLRGFLERVFFDPSRVPREFAEEALADMRNGQRVACLQRILSALLPFTDDHMSRPDWRPRRRMLRRLPLIRKPVLILWGAQDSLSPLAHGDLLARRIRGSGYMVIDRCGHGPQVERPAVTAELIARFAARPASLAMLTTGRLPDVTVEQRPSFLGRHRPR